jgi:hypothetical protein
VVLDVWVIRQEKRRFVDALGLFFVDAFIGSASWGWGLRKYEECDVVYCIRMLYVVVYAVCATDCLAIPSILLRDISLAHSNTRVN